MSPAKKNALANYGNFVVMALLGLVVNPLLAGALGPAAFGAWKACQRILDFGTVADGRATQALKWVIAYHAKTGDAGLRQRQVGAALRVWMLWLPVVTLLQAGLALALPWLITDLPEGVAGALYWTAAFLALNVILAGLMTLPDSALVGSNLGYRSMMVTTLVTALSNGAMVLVAMTGAGIIWLGVIVLGTTLLNGVITFVVARRALPWLGIRRPEPGETWALAQFSGWVLVWSLVTKFLLSAEVVLLAAVLGATAVAHFTFTGYVLQFALAICLMTTSAQMPGLGKVFGSGDLAGAGRQAREAREILFALATAICCLILLFNGPFVRLWVGTDFFMGQAANAAMALSFLQLAMIRCEAQIQDVGLKIGGKVLLGMGSTLLSMGLGWLFLAQSQSVAMMFVGLMLGRLPMSLGYPLLVRRMTTPSDGGARAAGYLCPRQLLVAALMVGLSLAMAPHVPEGSGFLLLALPGAALVVGLAVTTILPPRLWRGVLARRR